MEELEQEIERRDTDVCLIEATGAQLSFPKSRHAKDKTEFKAVWEQNRYYGITDKEIGDSWEDFEVSVQGVLQVQTGSKNLDSWTIPRQTM